MQGGCVCISQSFFRPSPLDNYNYNDLDLVVAVPVCSGLSIVTNGSKETKDSKNCNMLWLAYYTLNVIQPKCYVFENEKLDSFLKILSNYIEKTNELFKILLP